jgi:transcriptional regulator with XRE-family HTH domain
MPTWQRNPDPWTLAALASVGRSVERRRRQHGWSMRSLADRVGVAPSTILRLERGEIAASLLLVVRVAQVLGGLTIGTPEPMPPSWYQPRPGPVDRAGHPDRHPGAQDDEAAEGDTADDAA